jgi:hypothetical protein
VPNLHVHPYDVHPKLGRHLVLDQRTLAYQRSYCGEPIKPADHEPDLPVLDQEDLTDQGILLSQMFPGMSDLPALGSCGGNSGTEVAASLLTREEAAAKGLDTSDAVAAEKFAIGVYADATACDQWNDVQFPTDDCGTSGLAIAKVLKARGISDSYTTVKTAEEFARDLGHGTALYGTPWYQAWFEPVGPDALLDDITGWEASPIAGGHLVTATALERVAFHRSGRLDLKRTIVRFRNHWTSSWGDNGSFRMSLDLYQKTRDQVDILQPRRDTTR